MKRILMLSMLVWCGLCQATPFMVMAGTFDPNCQAVTYTSPNWADPNQIMGMVLPWVPNDPNGWSVKCGKRSRIGYWCDPDQHDVTIESMTDMWSVVKDPNGQVGRWALSGEIEPGGNYLVVRVVDMPGPEYNGPVEQLYTVVVWGEPTINHRPILAGIGWVALLLGWPGLVVCWCWRDELRVNTVVRMFYGTDIG